MKAIVISGFLTNLDDNIIPIIENNDVFIHTWKTDDNFRWIDKLQRYKRYAREFKFTMEEPIYDYKLFSLFHSTWKAVNLIDNIDKYEHIIKLKPDLDTKSISYRGRLKHYYDKARVHVRPLLSDIDIEECVFGLTYHQTLDERLFSGYPLAFRKIFPILYEDTMREVKSLNYELVKRYGPTYEGSIFWKEWLDSKGIKIILDTDLKLPNNKRDGSRY